MGRRRGRNEGSINQRCDGRWEARIDLGWHNGKRVRKSFYGLSRAAVAQALNKAVRDHTQGLPVAIERQTVQQFLADWLENTVRVSSRPSTYRSYEQIIRVHLIPELGRISLAKLAPQHVRTMLNRKTAESRLSPRSVAYLRVVLRAALNQARRWNLIAQNAAELVEPPRCQRFEIRPLSPDEARQLLDTVKNDRLAALYAVALACGLREGEFSL